MSACDVRSFSRAEPCLLAGVKRIQSESCWDDSHTMTKWPHHPNLRKKPHAPSKGRGPVQRAIRRAFMASGAEVLNSTDIYDWAHGRRRFGRRKSMPFGVYSRTLRTLRAMCEPVGRAPTTGRPWLWRRVAVPFPAVR